MNKVTSGSIGTKAFGVESLAKVRLVLGMSINILEIIEAMSKLTLVAVLALAILAELATQLGLVSAVVDVLALNRLTQRVQVDAIENAASSGRLDAIHHEIVGDVREQFAVEVDGVHALYLIDDLVGDQVAVAVGHIGNV